ncbi:hypothetical protein J2Z23_000029 [Lederbergia galactosidilyticus]|nr:hypothetical protein [Lederbergia galactosidilytica]
MRNPECGCGREDPDRIEKHIYHHIVGDNQQHHKQVPDKKGAVKAVHVTN